VIVTRKIGEQRTVQAIPAVLQSGYLKLQSIYFLSLQRLM
jgi:hypothetical protein